MFTLAVWGLTLDIEIWHIYFYCNCTDVNHFYPLEDRDPQLYPFNRQIIQFEFSPT